MGCGISETASDIEKIKSKSADYLNGLNSCGVIDWDTYNYAFDFYADLLMEAYEQGWKDAQPERKKGNWVYGEDEYGIDGYRCGKCGFFVLWDYAHNFINYIEDYNYCPNCGARMV